MLRGMLNLINAVVINRITETSDGMGGTSTTTSTVTIPRASIWQTSQGDRTISDKIAKTSSHVLAMEYGAHAFTPQDRTVSYNGNTYTITGNYDNVAERGELLLVGLQWIQ